MAFWDTPNCKIRYKSQSGTRTGRDPVTRAPIYTSNFSELDAFLKHAGKPVQNLFPGADETCHYLVGYLMASVDWPSDLAQNSEIEVRWNGSNERIRGEIQRDAGAPWVDDFYKSRSGSQRRTGDRIFVKISKEAEVLV